MTTETLGRSLMWKCTWSSYALGSCDDDEDL